MDRLPVEILLYIGQELKGHEGLQLLQVCRRWHALFFESVYSALDVDGSFIRPLVRAALNNPRIGPSIRELCVPWWHSYPDPRGEKETLESGVQQLVDQISQSPDEAADWAADLKNDNDEAWLALLLTLVPNLEAFYGTYCHPTPWIARVVSRAALNEPPFNARPTLQSFKIFHIKVANLKDALPVHQFVPFFYLPSLKTVTLCSANESEWWDPDTEYIHPALAAAAARGTSPVEFLTLRSYCNGRNGMVDLITTCAGLKKFIYQHNNQEFWGESYVGFRPRAFYSSLLTQKHSLEILHLNDVGEDVGVPDDDEDATEDSENRWFGSLVEFRRLWDLRMRVNNILNFHPSDRGNAVVSLKDILPLSLKWLYLSDCDEDHCPVLVPTLLDLLAHREERFPNLEKVVVYPAVVESPWHNPPSPLPVLTLLPQNRIPRSFREKFVPIQTMCDGAGVAFDILINTEGTYVVRSVRE